MTYHLLVKIEYPLKQGLKPEIVHSEFIVIVIVKIEYPLKQGLKLYNFRIIFIISYVKIEYPLKQGLKHHMRIST